MLEGLQAIWSLPAGATLKTMNEILTPERVMEIGQETWADFMNALPTPTT